MFALDVQTLTLLHSPQLPLRVRREDLSLDLSGLRPQHLSFQLHQIMAGATNASDTLGDATPC